MGAKVRNRWSWQWRVKAGLSCMCACCRETIWLRTMGEWGLYSVGSMGLIAVKQVCVTDWIVSDLGVAFNVGDNEQAVNKKSKLRLYVANHSTFMIPVSHSHVSTSFLWDHPSLLCPPFPSLFHFSHWCFGVPASVCHSWMAGGTWPRWRSRWNEQGF